MRPAAAQPRATNGSRVQIDSALRRAVDAKEVPGVVAVATAPNGVFYEGAFGTRSLAGGPEMTPDTIFRIASMTKAITSVSAMQLVEQGRLNLDAPIGGVLPELAAPQVLEGFDDAGKPKLRAAKRPITLRHLLTHTAGFGYEVWDENLVRYVKETGTPSTTTATLASLRLPLVFDPGERWEYGINIDWVGRTIEAVSGVPLAVYFREHVTGPLGMTDTDYVVSDKQQGRVVAVHQRKPDGALEPIAPPDPPWREFWSGGGGLYSTARDYALFLQMLLRQGRGAAGQTILRPQTVALMGQNQIGEIRAGILKTAAPARSNDVDFFPGMTCRWGLGYMLTPQPGPNGRSAGSVTWAGIFNTYYWLDPVKKIAGVYMAQILPFADGPAVRQYGEFEAAVYGGAKAA
ncbi:MAG: beta-lactamase family protein [Alphaproteobacteria bacterium]|nr:beta-lactamase family protein [Alphaproteobacteria bacterium]